MALFRKNEVLAWWLVPADYRLTYGDGREAKVGEIHSVAGPIKACSNGLHASEDLCEALELCPSSSTQLFLVKLHGELDGDTWRESRRSYQKIAARHRTYLGHVTVNQAVSAIILGVLKQGIADHNARILRYGKNIYKRMPKAIVQFSKDAVLTPAFEKAIAVPKYDTLRKVVGILRSKDTLTHKELQKVITTIGEQFAMEQGEIWALTEMIVANLMRKASKPARLALPKPVAKRRKKLT